MDEAFDPLTESHITKMCANIAISPEFFKQLLLTVTRKRFPVVMENKGWCGIHEGFKQRLIKDVAGYLRVQKDLEREN